MTDPDVQAAAVSRGPRALPRLGVAALELAAPVALAVLLAALSGQPMLLAPALALAALVTVAVVQARKLGFLGVWMVALTVSVLAGEMGALPLGGQSGRLLWADAVLAVGMLWALLRGGFTLEAPAAPFLVALLPFIAWCFITLPLARDVLTAIAELKEWAAALLVGAAAVCYARDARRALVLLATVALTGALLAVMMTVVCFRSPLGPVLTVLMKQVDLPWGRSNYLAGLLILSIPVALGLLGISTTWRGRLVWTATMAACALGLALSASKGAIIALVVALAIAFFRSGRISAAPRVVVLTVLSAGAAVFVAGPLRQVLSYRLAAGAIDYSAHERMALYRLAWDEFLRHPLLGLGLNNFSVISNRLHGVDTVPHNFELGFLSELGVPGLVMAVAWATALGRTAWRARCAARSPGQRALALGLWTAFLGFAVHNQFESTIYGQQFKMLLLVTAAATWRLAEDWERSLARDP